MIKRKKGFTLIEILFVLGVILAMTIIKTQDIENANLDFRAKIVADQISQIGQATNSYITLNYNKIVQLQNLNGVDGPLVCEKDKKRCQLTLETLRNSNLLPKSYSDKNIYNSGYKIDLYVAGSQPNYQINGLVTTDKSFDLNKNKNQILLGKIIGYAGTDSGFSSTNNKITGLFGGWNESNIDFPAINSSGLLGYRVGYKSNFYSIYLRRDGTLPMTGDLNMDGNNIRNIKNAYIDQNLSVKNNATIDGTVNVGKTLTAKDNIQSDKAIIAKSYFQGFNGAGNSFRLGGTDRNNFELTLYDNNKPLRLARSGSQNNSVILDTYGSVNTRGNITASGTIQADKLISKGRTEVGEFLALKRVSVENATCPENGLLSRDNSGSILSCINLKWVNVSSLATPTGAPVPWPSSVIPNGWLEANGQAFDKGKYKKLAVVYPSGRLPDLRGEFIRGWDHGRGVDEQTGRALLSSQRDQIQNITGKMPADIGQSWAINRFVDGAFRDAGGVADGDTGYRSGEVRQYTFDASRVARAGKETRGRNLAFMYIIRAE